MNFANVINGVQIGIVNIADTFKRGVPIGIINIVRNGYVSLSMGTDALSFNRLRFASGMHYFHTILSAGVRVNNNMVDYSYGIGFGAMNKSTSKLILKAELMTRFAEMHNQASQFNLQESISILTGFRIRKHLELTFGPTFNVLFSNSTFDSDTLLPSHAFSIDKSLLYQVDGWFGGQAYIGYRF